MRLMASAGTRSIDPQWLASAGTVPQAVGQDLAFKLELHIQEFIAHHPAHARSIDMWCLPAAGPSGSEATVGFTASLQAFGPEADASLHPELRRLRLSCTLDAEDAVWLEGMGYDDNAG